MRGFLSAHRLAGTTEIGGKEEPMAERKCAHGPCRCKVPEGKTYCSDRCREQAGDVWKGCACGHAGCR